MKQHRVTIANVIVRCKENVFAMVLAVVKLAFVNNKLKLSNRF
ncbi:MAG TPA: hypothetical protein VK431_02655 [Nitrosopumilaceae archaeon]|nr:hypothetical protein [Nitrosopumilaceae archaeon]